MATGFFDGPNGPLGKRLPRRFLSDFQRGQLAQFLVDKRHELIGGAPDG
jgi:hypothetical protein